MRRAAVVVLDVLAVAVAVLAAVIINAGGFVFWIADLRIRLRTPTRAFLWLAAVVLLRIVIDRRSAPFTVTRDGWRRFLVAPREVDRFVTGAQPGLWRRTAFAALGLALALGILLRDQLNQLYSVPDLGDPLFSIWRIGWVLHQLVADPGHLFDANIFHPERLTLTFSDPVILPALMAAPLVAVGVHPVVVYNVLLLSAFWLSGVATYALIDQLTGSWRAAFVAGLIYASYAYRFDHYSHLELQMTQWLPLGLLALQLFVATGRRRYAIGVAMAAVAQLYSSMYYAVFFLVYATAIGIGFVLAYRPPLRRLMIGVTAAAALSGLLAIPLARAFIAAQPAKGDRPVSEIQHYSATPTDYLRAHRYSLFWKDRALPPEDEHALFPGAAPVLFAAIGLIPPLSAVRAIYAVGLVVAVDGTMGFNGLTYRYLHEWLPPVRGLRVPTRFAALVGLTLAILSGFGVERLLRWCRRPLFGHVALAAMVGLVIVDAQPRLNLVPVWREPPAIYEALRDKPGVVLAEFPVVSPEPYNIPFMYFSIWHHTPMVNGYSGFIPRSYQALEPRLVDFRDVEELRARGVTHVTLNCGLDYQNCDESLAKIARVEGLRLVAESRWEDEQVRLYELLRR